MSNQIPVWACKRWGGYEHDWLDCFECQQSYELWMDRELESYGSVKDEEESDGHPGDD